MSSIIRGSDNIDSANLESGRAKAWITIDGTGTAANLKSFNVSSITDNGTGDYTATFTTAMSDANYCVAGAANSNNVADTTMNDFEVSVVSTTAVRIRTHAVSGSTAVDSDYAYIVVFGD